MMMSFPVTQGSNRPCNTTASVVGYCGCCGWLYSIKMFTFGHWRDLPPSRRSSPYRGRISPHQGST